jgi:glycerophosphoryl diester phosphodiesterase
MAMLRIGHRGAAGEAPENTLRSFRLALEQGADAVELDIRRTRDGALIVMHDADLMNLTGTAGLVSDTPMSHIRELRVKGERIPTLDETLSELGHYRKLIFLEVKEYGIEEQVVAAVENAGVRDVSVVVSFNMDSLRRIRRIGSAIPIGPTFESREAWVPIARGMDAQYISVMKDLLRREDIMQAHESGLKVLAWTVNTKEEMARFGEMQVDGIISDYPGMLHEVFPGS